jgi:hypothetical protein
MGSDVRDKYFGSHELQERKEVGKTSSDRSFGLVFAGFFVLLGALSVYSGSQRWEFWFPLGVLFGILALTAPRILAPLNRVWEKIGRLLHAIVSPVVIGLLFCVCITPIGFLMRLFGKDPLRLRLEPDAPSYWIRRVPPGPSSDSFKNQF